MTINLTIPATHELKPKITVVGVGGAGGNAVNNMITAHLEGVEFVAANTDAQALSQALTERRIQLGASLTQGLGAGARPDIGKAAAEEVLDGIIDYLQGANMVFITAGMGGGTGTGAAPVIAGAARDLGILTVGVVTKPFQFEGTQRMRLAESGIAELQKYVDTLIVIPNQNLFRIANEKTTFADAFKMADDVLYSGVRGVTDLMVMPGLINLDFADIRSVMMEMGKAMMGTGEAEGEKRAVEAAELAINNPLLDDVSLNGARGVLVNITGGGDMTLYEVDEACNRIRDQVDSNANIIFGSTFDDNLSGRVRVSVVATGIDAEAAVIPTLEPPAVVRAPQAEVLTDILDVGPASLQVEPDRESVAARTAAPAKLQSQLHEPMLHEATREPAKAAPRARVEPVLHTRRDAGFIAPIPVDPDALGASSLRTDEPRIDFGEERLSPPPASPLAQPEGAAPAIWGGTPSDGASDRKPAEDATLASRAKSSGASLFERMSRVARARSDVEPAAAPKAERPLEPQNSASRAGPASTPSRGQSEDDLLDIPAFLRRQRN